MKAAFKGSKLLIGAGINDPPAGIKLPEGMKADGLTGIKLLIPGGTKPLPGTGELVGFGLTNCIQNGWLEAGGSAFGAISDAQNGLVVLPGVRSELFNFSHPSGVMVAAGLIGIPDDVSSFDIAGHIDAKGATGITGSLAVLSFFIISTNGFVLAAGAGPGVVIGIPKYSSSFLIVGQAGLTGLVAVAPWKFVNEKHTIRSSL